jgi:hypothetical protein
MLLLPEVTLCAIESRGVAPILDPLVRSLSRITFGDVLLISSERSDSLPSSIRQIAISPFRNVAEYSRFVLFDLRQYVRTSHLLLIQWDGFVLDPDAWQPTFMDYDYIGAVWPQFEDGMKVGNGGFSLRSMRLLRALEDPELRIEGAEDIAICRTNRRLLEEKHGMIFAPPSVADRFSFERSAPCGATFGFHGLFNFERVYGLALPEVLSGIAAPMLRNRDARDLCRTLLDTTQPALRTAGHCLAWRLFRDRPWSWQNIFLIGKSLAQHCLRLGP